MRSGRRDVCRVALRDPLNNSLHKITHAEGSAMVANGLAVVVRNYAYGRNEIVAYRLTEQARPSNSHNSVLMLNAAIARLGAGEAGESFTARLPEWDTKGRDSKRAREESNDPRQPAEDFIEQAMNKVRHWHAIPLTNPRRLSWA